MITSWVYRVFVYMLRDVQVRKILKPMWLLNRKPDEEFQCYFYFILCNRYLWALFFHQGCAEN